MRSPISTSDATNIQMPMSKRLKPPSLWKRLEEAPANAPGAYRHPEQHRRDAEHVAPPIGKLQEHAAPGSFPRGDATGGEPPCEHGSDRGERDIHHEVEKM